MRIEALRRAIQKANLNHTDKIKVLQTNIEQPNQKKIALQTGGGILFLELNQILYLKADSSYTHFITAEGRKITVTKRISEYERLEEIGNFLRIHRSHSNQSQFGKKNCKTRRWKCSDGRW